jgi:tetratricopeptide (TPR) repeat protein
VAQGQLEAALRNVQTAQQLNPLSPIINARLGTCYYYLGRYDQAAAVLRQAIELDSTNVSARAELARVLVQQHRYPEALAALPDAFDLQAGHLGGGTLGYIYGRAGRRQDALATGRRLEQRAHERYIDLEAFAIIALGLGDTTKALDWLEHARQERTFYLPFLAADPIFAPLHRNPRYLRIVQAIGLRVPVDTATNP